MYASLVASSKKSFKKDKSKNTTKRKVRKATTERLIDNKKVLERLENIANKSSTHFQSFEFLQTSKDILFTL